MEPLEALKAARSPEAAKCSARRGAHSEAGSGQRAGEEGSKWGSGRSTGAEVEAQHCAEALCCQAAQLGMNGGGGAGRTCVARPERALGDLGRARGKKDRKMQEELG